MSQLFDLIHGAGSDAWYWHLVAGRLRAAGHEVVTPDLPCADDRAGLDEYVRVVLDSLGDRRGAVVAAQSLAGFTAPLVCGPASARLLVLVNAMVPYPGEPPGEWWDNTGWQGPPLDTEQDLADVFLHDLPPALAAEAKRRARDQSGTPFEKPWPLQAWPGVPTRALVGRDDRFFTAGFQRRVLRERLSLVPDEIGGGHLLALSRPGEVAERLVAWARAPETAPVPRFSGPT